MKVPKLIKVLGFATGLILDGNYAIAQNGVIDNPQIESSIESEPIYEIPQEVSEYLSNHQSITNINALMNIAESVGPNPGLGWAFEYLPADLFEENSNVFVKLANATGERAGWAYANLSRDLFKTNLDDLLDIANAAGKGTGDAYKNLPIKSFRQNPSEIVDIANATGEHVGLAYDNLPEDLFLENPDAFVELANCLGKFTRSAYWKLPEDLFLENPDGIIDIACASGKNVDQTFDNLPKDLFLENPNGIVRLANELGEDVYDVYRSLPKKLFKKNPEEIFRIVHKYNKNSVGLFESFGEDIVEVERKFSSHLNEIANFAGKNANNAYSNLHKTLFLENPDAFVRIANSAGKNTSLAYRYLPVDLFIQNSEAIVELSNAALESTYEMYGYLPVKAFKRNPDSLVEIANKYYVQGWGLFKSFGEEVVELEKKYSSHLNKIAKSSTSHTSEAFEQLTKDLFIENLNKFVELASIAGDGVDGAGVPGAYKSISQLLEGFESFEDLMGVLRVNKEEFGIQFVGRYASYNLLKRNISDRESINQPIVVAILPKYDWNGAFSNMSYVMNELFNNNSTFIYETDNDEDAFDIIKQVANEYGCVYLPFLNGHGSQSSLQLGNPKIVGEDKSKIGIEDESKLKLLDSSLCYDASIVLGSCSTGEGKEKGNNLANAFARALPGKKIYSPNNSVSIGRISFEDGKVSDVQYIRYGMSIDTYVAFVKPNEVKK